MNALAGVWLQVVIIPAAVVFGQDSLLPPSGTIVNDSTSFTVDSLKQQQDLQAPPESIRERRPDERKNTRQSNKRIAANKKDEIIIEWGLGKKNMANDMGMDGGRVTEIDDRENDSTITMEWDGTDIHSKMRKIRRFQDYFTNVRIFPFW